MNSKIKKLNRIAILSIHTSPLHQPGFGDSGGMNVYITETAKRIAKTGIDVEIFTRATSTTAQDTMELAPGVLVRHLPAGPFEGLRKEELPAQLCAVTAGLLRAEASRSEGFYDVIHSHYWLSGQVGWIAKERWDVPLVHTMHTMALVKNQQLAFGDTPEPAVRIIGEQQVVEVADRLVANTDQEATELVELYGAEPTKVHVIHPGVDLDAFVPGDQRLARARLGINEDAIVLLFVGRIQPLKGPEVLLQSAAELLKENPEFRTRLMVAICGGPSGTGLQQPKSLQSLTDTLGLRDVVRFIPPVNRSELVTWFQAATLNVVPSYSESFGLVALESQACGTPVVASRVGGLVTTVRDGVSGLLVDGHNPSDWAAAITRIVSDEAFAARLRKGTRTHAELFDWNSTANELIDIYTLALNNSSYL